MATRLQSEATSRTMNFLMACKEGVESMLKWVGVSVEGETRVGGINHFNCVKLKIQKCEKLCLSEHLRIHKFFSGF